jgi:hypothetical protein
VDDWQRYQEGNEDRGSLGYVEGTLFWFVIFCALLGYGIYDLLRLGAKYKFRSAVVIIGGLALWWLV